MPKTEWYLKFIFAGTICVQPGIMVEEELSDSSYITPIEGSFGDSWGCARYYLPSDIFPESPHDEPIEIPIYKYMTFKMAKPQKVTLY